ncbi:MAG: glycosyltransferase [Candidatus Binatia bacterium]
MTLSKPLRILMLVSSYPRTREDTASTFLRYLAESLTRRGHRVHVLAPADKQGGTFLEEEVTTHRFRYFLPRLQQLAYGSGILSNLRHKPWLWIQVPFFLISMTFSLLALIRKERPDLIHAHWVLPQGLVAVFAKRFFKIAVLTTAHGGDAFVFRGKLIGWLKRLVLARSNAWTSNTRATSDAFGPTAFLPTPCIIPMGVDVDQFSSGERTTLRRRLSENETVVLFVGRLVEKKGGHDLLKAFSLLPPELRARTTLWVVGDGAYYTKLHQYAEDLGITNKVYFWGGESNQSLPKFYAAADLFVAPSIEAEGGDTEGQGVVLLEAFAARLCVVATRVGGISEVVADGRTGLLVEPHNPTELAAAMERLLRNPTLRVRLAENAFAKVREDYSWQTIAADFEALYRKII